MQNFLFITCPNTAETIKIITACMGKTEQDNEKPAEKSNDNHADVITPTAKQITAYAQEIYDFLKDAVKVTNKAEYIPKYLILRRDAIKLMNKINPSRISESKYDADDAPLIFTYAVEMYGLILRLSKAVNNIDVWKTLRSDAVELLSKIQINTAD